MKLLGTLVLTLALSASAYAGNMQNGVVQPPPPPSNMTQTVEITETDETPETTEQTSTVTEIMLTVVRVLGLL